MGWYTCSACGGGGTESFEDLNIGCCERGDESFLCDRCDENMERKNCGKCGSNFCENHGDFEPTECCDQYLCKWCNTEDVGDEAHGKIESSTTCGHWKCNYYNGPGHCSGCYYMCEYEESKKKQCVENGLKRRDEPLANTLLKNCKSDSLKECLQSWLKTVPPENNSRKRDDVADDDGVVDSAKSNKKCKADADVEVIVID